MNRHLLRPLLWLVFTLTCGVFELLSRVLGSFAKLRFKGVFVLAALVAAARSGTLVVTQLPLDSVRPLGIGIEFWGYAVAIGTVFALGLTSRVRRRLWARLVRRRHRSR